MSLDILRRSSASWELDFVQVDVAELRSKAGSRLYVEEACRTSKDFFNTIPKLYRIFRIDVTDSFNGWTKIKTDKNTASKTVDVYSK
jgi:hypothetical protein